MAGPQIIPGNMSWCHSTQDDHNDNVRVTRHATCAFLRVGHEIFGLWLASNIVEKYNPLLAPSPIMKMLIKGFLAPLYSEKRSVQTCKYTDWLCCFESASPSFDAPFVPCFFCLSCFFYIFYLHILLFHSNFNSSTNLNHR